MLSDKHLSDYEFYLSAESLPNGWEVTTLDDIAHKITDGTHKTPNYQAQGVRFISIKNIKPFRPIDWSSYEKYIAEYEHHDLIKRCNPEYGDILFPRIGTLGYAKRIDFKEEVSIFVGLGLIKPNYQVIRSKYLEYYMNTAYIDRLSRKNANGSGRLTLPLAQTKRFPIPIAPLREQERIVEKIETLFARLDKGEEAVREAQKLLARYRQSVLKAAVTGQLTAVWRAERAASLEPGQALLARILQTLIEQNLETLLGVRFLATEYKTSNGGRMDTLGIDENGYPVIIEYKRDRSENVINQGLFYLDWLMDHRGDFELLVRDRFDKAAADAIEWSAPRLICIASDFTKYDMHAINQMSRNIELIRYRRFGEELLLLDLLTAVSTEPAKTPIPATGHLSGMPAKYKTNAEYLADASESLGYLYADIETFMIGLGDDVTRKELRLYFAFKRIKNFACAEIRPQLGAVRLYLKIDPSTIELESGFARDVRHVGHFGTGDLEVTVKTHDDFERAKPLIIQSYEAS